MPGDRNPEIQNVVAPTKPGESAAAERVTLREKTALGLGLVTALGSHNVVHVTAYSIYNVELGLSPALLGVVLFIQRIWDAALDPLVGHFSDNFRSRYGRRRPFLAVAVGPLAVLFAAMWLVPRGATSQVLFGYLLASSMLFYAARSLYWIPLLGLQVETSADYHERTRLAGFTEIFFAVFAILPTWLFALVAGPLFPDAVTGIHAMGLALGGLFLLTGVAPVFFVHERAYARVARQQARAPLRESLATVMRNRPFLLVLGMQAAATFGYNVVGVLGMYINYYYVYGGDIRRGAIMQGWNGTFFQVGAIGSVFLYRRLSVSIGKRSTAVAAAAILAGGSACKWLLFRPEHPWLQIPIWVFNGAGITGITVMGLSMLADAADYEEWRSGARREGVYVSILSLVSKIAYSTGALVSSFLLVATGFEAKLGGAQAARAMFLMRLFYATFPLVGALGAALVIRRYPLTERAAVSIQADLERRRVSPIPRPAH